MNYLILYNKIAQTNCFGRCFTILFDCTAGGNLAKMIEKYDQTQQTMNETQLKRLVRHVAKVCAGFQSADTVCYCVVFTGFAVH